MNTTPLQDRLPKDSGGRICFGCGADNHRGLRIKSHMEGDECVCRFTPEEHHAAFPNILNGGIIATIMDCHAIWTSVGARHRTLGYDDTGESRTMFVTKKMTVEFLKPTPMGTELEVRARVVETRGKSSRVIVELRAKDGITARAEVTAVRVED
ncbi:MAG: PaaI family thioesterase [Spirochaetes bacterium]|nr:MAG: PaaI family thioesterase [Spirochaetota bacterium]